MLGGVIYQEMQDEESMREWYALSDPRAVTPHPLGHSGRSFWPLTSIARGLVTVTSVGRTSLAHVTFSFIVVHRLSLGLRASLAVKSTSPLGVKDVPPPLRALFSVAAVSECAVHQSVWQKSASHLSVFHMSFSNLIYRIFIVIGVWPVIRPLGGAQRHQPRPPIRWCMMSMSLIGQGRTSRYPVPSRRHPSRRHPSRRHPSRRHPSRRVTGGSRQQDGSGALDRLGPGLREQGP